MKLHAMGLMKWHNPKNWSQFQRFVSQMCLCSASQLFLFCQFWIMTWRSAIDLEEVQPQQSLWKTSLETDGSSSKLLGMQIQLSGMMGDGRNNLSKNLASLVTSSSKIGMCILEEKGHLANAFFNCKLWKFSHSVWNLVVKWHQVDEQVEKYECKCTHMSEWNPTWHVVRHTMEQSWMLSSLIWHHIIQCLRIHESITWRSMFIIMVGCHWCHPPHNVK